MSEGNSDFASSRSANRSDQRDIPSNKLRLGCERKMRACRFCDGEIEAWHRCITKCGSSERQPDHQPTTFFYHTQSAIPLRKDSIQTEFADPQRRPNSEMSSNQAEQSSTGGEQDGISSGAESMGISDMLDSFPMPPNHRSRRFGKSKATAVGEDVEGAEVSRMEDIEEEKEEEEHEDDKAEVQEKKKVEVQETEEDTKNEDEEIEGGYEGDDENDGSLLAGMPAGFDVELERVLTGEDIVRVLLVTGYGRQRRKNPQTCP
ncbi:hypothetical protein BU16DRAFT_590174 [Lophium mytilinum]|uniref:Uncharacterized protein n=1 Tax=Lophium mytilinum TaxID=390894 RepID=A0A6A6QT82_9PEZI|nr:hypothetical protein BU16DRAFT_590174 [Lophium mytilinum]